MVKDEDAEIAFEFSALAKANAGILEGEERFARQAELVATLRGRGREWQAADHLLTLMRQTLIEWYHHRELIVARLIYLETRPKDSWRKRTDHDRT